MQTDENHRDRPAPRPMVVSATEVAELLGWRSADSFHRNRAALEEHGFPRKLPGINGWSRPAITRWLTTNGATHLPADMTGQDNDRVSITIDGEARP